MNASSTHPHRPTNPTAISLVAIGDELLNGKITDTNSSYIAKTLRSQGIAVRSIRLVGDTMAGIDEALQQALDESSYVLCTGGLGPTSDDLTRDAIAALIGQPLVEDAASLSRLTEYCERRGRALNQNNRTQVYFPRGATIIENRWGTADAFEVGFVAATETKRILALPGVPREMRGLVESFLLPRLKELFPGTQAPAQRSFRLFGIPESSLGEKIDALGLDTNILVSYRPQFPEILLELTLFNHEYLPVLDAAAKRVRALLGTEYIFSEIPGQQLAEVTASLLAQQQKTIACAESCSGGMVADAFVSQAGASHFFLGSIVAYANSLKQSLLGISNEILTTYGAVSEECARTMANAARERCGADFGLAITGIAGPDGGTEEKPVGTVWVALAGATGTSAHRLNLQWDRDMTRRYASHFAINCLRMELLGEQQ